MQGLVRKAAEIPEDKREHLPNYLNQRLVTNGKSKNGMKGRKLLSTLNDDFTVDLQDWRPEGFVDEGGRNERSGQGAQGGQRLRGADHPWTDRGDD